MIEHHVGEITVFQRQNAPERGAFLAELKTLPTDIDGRREAQWSRGSYFHAYQDLVGSIMLLNFWNDDPDDQRNRLMQCQSCFAQDLEAYTLGLREIEPDELAAAEIFSAIFETGLSARWADDESLVRGLHAAFRKVDDDVLRPWCEG